MVKKLKYIEIPISKVKEDYREINWHCKDGQAVVLTRYGKRKYIILAYSDFEQLIGREN